MPGRGHGAVNDGVGRMIAAHRVNRDRKHV
jgi:hypothetical protein